MPKVSLKDDTGLELHLFFLIYNEHLSKSNGGETWSLVTCGLPFAVCRKRDSKSHCCMVILMTCMYQCTLSSFLDVQSPKGGSPIEGK